MRRDAHGRAARADNDPRRRPADGFRLRDATRFQRVVVDAIATLPGRLAGPLADARVVVEAVPPAGGEQADVPLARFRAPLLTVYRRPLESRASDRADLEEAVRVAVGEAVAAALGLDDDLDDLHGDED